MRFSLIVVAVLLTNAAVAQEPQSGRSPAYGIIGEPLVLEEVQKLPPDAAMTIVMPGSAPTRLQDTTVADVLKLLRQGKEVRQFRQGPTQPSCPVDYSEIDAEKKASDERLRQMERRGDIIPLQHQYEQEMYYETRRKRIYEKTCGEPPTNFKIGRPDMRKKACEALGVVCKPVKHW